MATWSDVRRIAGSLPEVDEQTMADGSSRWRVRRTLFVWERPLRRGDLDALGDQAPEDPPLAARVADVGVRAAMIAEEPDPFSRRRTSTAIQRCWLGSTGCLWPTSRSWWSRPGCYGRRQSWSRSSSPPEAVEKALAAEAG